MGIVEKLDCFSLCWGECRVVPSKGQSAVKNARRSYFGASLPFSEHSRVSNVGRWAEEDEKVWSFRAGPFPARNALTLVTSGFRTTFYASAWLCNRPSERIERSFISQKAMFDIDLREMIHLLPQKYKSWFTLAPSRWLITVLRTTRFQKYRPKVVLKLKL